MRDYSEREKQLIEEVFLENKSAHIDTNSAFEFAKAVIENCINNETVEKQGSTKKMEIFDFLKEPGYGYHMLAKFREEPAETDRIMFVELSSNKRILIVNEACDNEYCIMLNKSQVLEWIEDLKKITDVMEE